ncbi:protein PAXX isoform X7 [Phyllostomus hastatus]|uniref:protein PAXX isoform X7 n=1 Tax=Phyllostomus hastatus TaxID=9423 RepID=UPI001E67FBD8|nr:protein PAXX isoform X7 [Phyllostomus hastatus]
MVPPPPLCTLPPGPGPPRFICYCEEEKAAGASDQGGFSLCVTDAAELWSTCFTPDGLAALKARFGLSAAEDVTPRFSLQAAGCDFHSSGGRSNPDPLGGPLHTGLRALQSAGPRGGPQAAGTDPGPGRAHVQLGAAAGICGGDGCLPQEEPLASGASAVPTRPRFSERLPRTWGQEAVSRRVPHQPWLQKKPASGVDFDDL